MAYRTVLVPHDFSRHATAALDTAVDLAERLDADLHLLHAITYPVYGAGMTGAVMPAVQMEQVRRTAETSLSEAAKELDLSASRVETHVVEGVGIASAIRETADRLRADLIVMGTHGRTGWSHVLLGSVAERTLRQAPCPVLTVRAPEGT